MSTFQTKPVIIEAEQFDGRSVPPMLMFNPDTTVKGIGAYYDDHAQFPISLTIETLEGNLKPNPGDWIIKGPGSEWSICKREVFGKMYYAVVMDGTEDETA